MVLFSVYPVIFAELSVMSKLNSSSDDKNPVRTLMSSAHVLDIAPEANVKFSLPPVTLTVSDNLSRAPCDGTKPRAVILPLISSEILRVKGSAVG